MQTYPSKRSPSYRSKRSKSRCEKRYRSRDMCSGLGSLHYQGKQEQDRNDEPDANMESEEEEEKEEEEEVEVEDCDYDGDDDNVNDDDYDDDEEDDSGDEFKDLVLGRKRKSLDNYVIRSMPFIGVKKNRVTRYSANVVLLAHGNRSLYVLTIQRNQVTSIDSSSFTRHSNHRSSSTTMISYKL